MTVTYLPSCLSPLNFKLHKGTDCMRVTSYSGLPENEVFWDAGLLVLKPGMSCANQGMLITLD